MILTSIKSAIGLEKIAAEKTIRIKIFVKEQGFQNEFDEIDPNAFHIVLFDKDKPIGTGRCYVDKTRISRRRWSILRWVLPSYKNDKNLMIYYRNPYKDSSQNSINVWLKNNQTISIKNQF